MIPVIGSVSLYFWFAHDVRTASIFAWQVGVHAICEHSPLSVDMYAPVYLFPANPHFVSEAHV